MKGQFFIITLLFMAVIIAEVAVFTTESKQLQRQLGLPAEPGVESEMAGYTQELKSALEGKVYSGNASYVNTTINNLKSQAAKSGKDLKITCSEGQAGDTYSLDCTLSLTTTAGTFTQAFHHTVTISVSVKTYSDDGYTKEESFFKSGDTVYYELKSNDNTKTYNVTLYNGGKECYSSGRECFQENVTTTNFFDESEFRMDRLWPDGEYNITVNGTVRKTFYYNFLTITLATKSGQATQSQFNRGDTVGWDVTIKYYNGTNINTPFNMQVFHANGKPSDYGSEGTTVSGAASGSFKLSANEPLGSMELRVTEYKNDQSKSAYIEVVEGAPSKFSAAVIPANAKHNEAWSPGDADYGYTAWYDNTGVEYHGIPFKVLITSGDDVARVDGSLTVILPSAHGTTLHFLTASAVAGDCT
jgi:hypothetical protein